MMGLPAGVGSIVAALGVVDVNFSQGLSDADKKAKQAAQNIEKAMNRIMLAGVGIFALAIKEATQFETKMNEVGSLLGGEGKEQLEKYKKEMLDFATKTPLALNDLTTGLYNIVSATVPLNEQMDVLKSASQAAVAGVSDLTSTFNLGSAIVKGYGMQFSEIDKVYDVVFQTIKDGQTTMGELASSMGHVIPIASAAGVSLQEVSAAVASTAGVTGTTSEAVTQLRSVLNELMSPSKELTQIYDKYNAKTGKEFIERAGGMQKAIALIVKEHKESEVPLQKFIGRVEGQTAALALAGPLAEDFTKKLGNMKTAWTVGGVAAEAYEIQMNSFSNQAKVAGNIMKTALIETGNQVLPVFTNMLKIFNEHPEAIQAIVKAVSTLVITIGGMIAAYKAYQAISSAVSAANRALNSSFGVIGLAVTALVTVFTAIKAAQEAYHKSQLKGIEAIGSESKVLTDLIAEYNRLKAIQEPTAQQKLELEKVSNELRAALQGEKIALENVNIVLDEFILKKDAAAREELAEKIKETEERLERLNANRKIQIAQRKEELELLKEEYAKLTDKMNAHKEALELLNQKEITGADAIQNHIEKLRASIKENENNKIILDKLNAELKRYETQLNEVTAAAEKKKEETKKLKSTLDLLKDAGVKTTAEFENEKTALEKLISKVQFGSVEYKQLAEKLKAVYEQLGETDAWLDLNKSVVDLEANTEALNVRFDEVPDKLEPIEETVQALSNEVGTSVSAFDKLTAGIGLTGEEADNLSINLDELISGMFDIGSDPAAQEAFGLFSETLGLAGKEAASVVGDVHDLASALLDLGPAAQEAFDKFSQGLEGILSGSVSPLQGGIQAITYAVNMFGGESEKVALTIEQVYTNLGKTGEALREVTEFMESFNNTIQSDLIEQYNESLKAWTENYKNTQDSLAAERIEYWTKRLGELTEAFNLQGKVEQAGEAIDQLISQGNKLVTEFGGWDFPGAEGFATLLDEQIVNLEGLMATLDPTSLAYQNLATQLELARMMQEKLNAGTVEMTQSLFTELTGMSDLTDQTRILTDAWNAYHEAGVKEGDSKKVRDAKIREYIQSLQEENKSLDENSQQYKDNEDAIVRMNYALAMSNGYGEDFYTWLQETGNTLHVVEEALDANREAIEENGGAFHYLAEKIKITIDKMGGLTKELADAVKESKDSMSKLAKDALELSEYYGNIKFPKMEEELRQAILDNEALLRTLDPQSQAYRDLQFEIEWARAALAKINGEVKDTNQYFAEQIKKVGMAGQTFAEKTKKMEEYLNTIMDVNAPIDEQIQFLEGLIGKLQVGTVEYEYLMQKLRLLQGELEGSNEYYAEQIKLVGMAGQAYEDKAALMEEYLQTIMDTNAPLDEQITFLEGIIENLEEGTAEYVYIKQKIEEMKEELEETNEVMDEHQQMLDELKDAGIELESEVIDDINTWADLATQVEANSYEYEQLMKKIEGAIGKFVDFNAPVEDQIAQLEALKEKSGLSAEALAWIDAKLEELYGTMEDDEAVNQFTEGMNSVTESMEEAAIAAGMFSDEYVNQLEDAYDEITRLTAKALELKGYYGDVSFPDMEANLMAAISSNTALLATLDPMSQAYKDLQDQIILAEAALAVLRGEVASTSEYLIKHGIILNDLANQTQILMGHVNQAIAGMQETADMFLKASEAMGAGMFAGAFAEEIEAFKATIAQNKLLLAQLDPTSDAYKRLQNEIWLAEAALMVATGAAANIEEALAAMGVTLYDVGEGAGGAEAEIKSLAERFQEAQASAEGFTQSLLKEFDAAKDSMANMADELLQMQAYFGGGMNMQGMMDELQAAIDSNQALLATLDPSSQAYMDLQDEIWQAQAAMMVLNGQAESVEEALAMMGVTLYSTANAANAAAQAADAAQEAFDNMMQEAAEGTYTQEFLDYLKQSQSAMNSLAEQALKLKDYYGNVKFPEMEQELEDTINANYDLLATLDPTSQAYADLEYQIHMAEAALAVMRGEVGSVAEWFEMMGLEMQESLQFVYEWEDGIADLMGQFNQMGQNFDTVMNMIEQLQYYGIDLDTTGADEAIMEQIAGWEELLATMEPGTQAYADMQDQIWQAQAAMMVLTGQAGSIEEALAMMGVTLNSTAAAEAAAAAQAEAAAAAFNEMLQAAVEGEYSEEFLSYLQQQNDALTSLTEQALQLADYYGDVEFPEMEADLEASIAANQQLLATLDPQSQAYADLQYEILMAQAALAVLRGEVGSVAEWFEQMGIEMHESLQFVYEWEEGIGGMMNQFDQMGANFDTVMDMIEQLQYYNIDLDTTGADEAIMNQIASWEELLATLDPSSQAYADLQNQIWQAQAAMMVLRGEASSVEEAMAMMGHSMEETAQQANATAQAFEQMMGAAAGGQYSQEFVTYAEQQMNAMDDLIEQAMHLHDYYGDVQFPDMEEQIMESIAANQALLETLDPNSQAYADLADQIILAQAALAVLQGQYDSIEEYLEANNITLNSQQMSAEDLKNSLTGLYDQLADLEDQKLKLDFEFEQNKAKLEQKIKDTQDKIQDLIEKKAQLKFDFQVETAATMAKIEALRALMEQMGHTAEDAGWDMDNLSDIFEDMGDISWDGDFLTGLRELMDKMEAEGELEGFENIQAILEDLENRETPLTFYEIAQIIEELTGRSMRLTMVWGEMLDTMFQEFEGFESDFETAMDALEQMAYFNVDFDTTTADEQIAAAILRMQDYMATLDPNSQAYADAQAMLNELIAKFQEMGGVIDEEAAQEWYTQEAASGMESLWDYLNQMQQEYGEQEMAINMDLEQLYEDLAQLQDDMDALIENYEDAKLKLELEIGLVTDQIAALLEMLAAMNNSGGTGTGGSGEEEESQGGETGGGGSGGTPPPFHTGGFGWQVVAAHSGLLAANERLVRILSDEVVIPGDVVKQYSTDRWIDFIMTGNYRALAPQEVQPVYVKPSYDIRINTNDINTQLWIKEQNETWWYNRSKYKREVSTYGY